MQTLWRQSWDAGSRRGERPLEKPQTEGGSPGGILQNAFDDVRVVTIDGPAGSGKSTVSRMLAGKLGWIYVTTGAIYRTLALMLTEAGTSVHDVGSIERFVAFVSERYRQESRSGRVYLGEREVSQEIRSPAISEQASIVAQDELVRRRLLPVQRRIVLECNGAVVDGRDMGTVVFPDAPLKIFLTAASERRASRRLEELRAQGKEVALGDLVKEIHERDMRDANRSVAPMRQAEDAILVDSTELDPAAIVGLILKHCVERNLVPQL